MSDGWLKIIPGKCDLCGRRALWCHPKWGLRCGICPRQRETLAQRLLREAVDFRAAWRRR